MTGAEKFIFGMLAGGWKFGGKPPGRPGCWELACIPGGGATPGADMPGGATTSQAGSKEGGTMTYAYPMKDPSLAAHFDLESSQTPEAVHKPGSLPE